MSESEKHIRSARRSMWFHRGAAGFWALLLVPTLLWWRESVLWVAAMSLYANVGTHWSAAEGAEAKLRAQEG